MPGGYLGLVGQRLGLLGDYVLRAAAAASSIPFLDTSDFYAPFADAGSGAVTLTLTRGTGSATFTRATAAAARLSDGTWKLDVASGTARSHYLEDSTYAGVISERTSTNRCLWNRDFTDAAWANVNVTAAKDATGIDGAANSCSTLTAGAIGGTSLQTITNASAARVLSAFVKRKTGTGAVNLTLDGGVSSTDISGLINSTTFTRVSRTQTLANPVIGFSFGASGDEIIVDCIQEETDLATGSAFTAPIVTTTAAVTRNEDALNYDTANIDGTQGVAYGEFFDLYTGTAVGTTCINTGSNATGGILFRAGGSAKTVISMDDGPTALSKTGLASVATAIRKRACHWGGVVMSITGDGAAVATGTFDGSFTVTELAFGRNPSGANAQSNTMKNVRIWLADTTDANIQAITT